MILGWKSFPREESKVHEEQAEVKGSFLYLTDSGFPNSKEHSNQGKFTMCSCHVQDSFCLLV